MRNPWQERLLWIGLGAALAGVVFWWSSAGAETSQAVAPKVEPAEEVADTPSAITGPLLEECYLGVVMAREAVDVSPETDGLIEEIRVRVGDRVEQGQLIARLDKEVLVQQLTEQRSGLKRAEAQMRRSEIDVDQSTQEHLRRQSLNEKGLLSNEEREAARFEREKASASRDAAQAESEQARSRIRQLETALARTEIRAPFNGTVAQRYVDPGSRARAGLPVVRLLSTGNLLARFAVPPKVANGLHLEVPVRVEIETLRQAYPAIVEQIAPEIDVAAQMVFVEARLDLAGLSAPEVPSGSVARVSIAGDLGSATASCLAPPS